VLDCQRHNCYSRDGCTTLGRADDLPVISLFEKFGSLFFRIISLFRGQGICPEPCRDSNGLAAAAPAANAALRCFLPAGREIIASPRGSPATAAPAWPASRGRGRRAGPARRKPASSRIACPLDDSRVVCTATCHSPDRVSCGADLDGRRASSRSALHASRRRRSPHSSASERRPSWPIFRPRVNYRVFPMPGGSNRRASAADGLIAGDGFSSGTINTAGSKCMIAVVVILVNLNLRPVRA
jgi:hypothetical protein